MGRDVARSVGAACVLIRPANLAMAAAAILIGARFSGGAGGASGALVATLLPTIAAALLLVAAGYAWNDAADAERDRIAHPRRPVASGRISRRAARGVALALFAAGALAVLAAPPAPRALLVAWAALLLAYRAIAQRAPVLKNGLAAALTASAVVLGGLLGAAPSRALFPALFAFLLSWIREAMKDLSDVEGDRAVGSISWIDAMPRPRAGRIVRAAIVLLLALIPIPAVLFGYGPVYLAVAGLGVGATLVVLYRDLGDPDRALADPAALARTCRRLKGSMAAGMLALLAGGIAAR